MLLTLSVSSNASPPFTGVGIYEPTIKQTVAVTPQAILTVTPTAYAMDYVTADLIHETLFTSAKPQPMVQLVCPTSPIQSVDGLDVLSYDVANDVYDKRIPDLASQYIESRATEYSV